MASLAEIMVSFVGTVPMSIRSAVHRGLEFYGFSPQWRLRKQGRNLAQLNIDRLSHGAPNHQVARQGKAGLGNTFNKQAH